MSEFESLLKVAARPCVAFAVSLGNTSLRVVSDASAFGGRRFFAQRAFLANNAPVDYEVWCIEDRNGAVRRLASGYPPDASHRARAFAAGYYATDHFGEPVLLHRLGRRFYMVGVGLERPLWTFLVKALIFYTSLEKRQLFLKAAAVELGGGGVLIAGRGGGGKTTLVQTLCRYGARFVTNSHAIVGDCKVIGVPTNMRVRELDPGLEQGYPALSAGERLVDPFEHYPSTDGEPLALQRLLIVDHIPRREEGVRRLEPEHALSFLDQFALGVNVYGLEEEMMEHCGGDFVHFGREASALRSRLQCLTEQLPCFLIRTDARDTRKHGLLLEILGGR